jgi:uncharacterized protein YcfJ
MYKSGNAVLDFGKDILREATLMNFVKRTKEDLYGPAIGAKQAIESALNKARTTMVPSLGGILGAGLGAYIGNKRFGTAGLLGGGLIGSLGGQYLGKNISNSPNIRKYFNRYYGSKYAKSQGTKHDWLKRSN